MGNYGLWSTGQSNDPSLSAPFESVHLPPILVNHESLYEQKAFMATLTYMPAKSGTSLVNLPASSIGQGGISSGRRIPLAREMRWSSSPKAGAWCTIPVPSASVTYVSITTLNALSSNWDNFSTSINSKIPSRTHLFCKILKHGYVSPPFQISSLELGNLFELGLLRIFVQGFQQIFMNDKLLIAFLIMDLDVDKIRVNT